MNRDDINTERGDSDIVFVRPELDMEEVSEEEEPRKIIEEEMREEGLEWRNARIVGLFKDDFSLMLDDGGKIILEGEQVYP